MEYYKRSGPRLQRAYNQVFKNKNSSLLTVIVLRTLQKCLIRYDSLSKESGIVPVLQMKKQISFTVDLRV